MSTLVSKALGGEWHEARNQHYRLLPLLRALFRETNPVPVKALLAELGRCTAEVRLPLVEAEGATRAELSRAFGALAPLARAASPG
jgi:4-hydroxy-tetrahydrodipicolinate synthase